MRTAAELAVHGRARATRRYDHDDEVLQEEAILGWASAAEEGAEEGSLEARLLAQAEGLLTWLKEADEDEDDDDDE